MHTRLFYYYFIFLSIILASCKQNKEQAPELDLDDIMAIYCTPTDLAQCLPLEITKDANGWKAEYVGTPSMERKQLKPRLSLDEIGDTIVVFDEYMGESFNGSYSLCRGTELFPHYRELFYCNSQNQDS